MSVAGPQVQRDRAAVAANPHPDAGGWRLRPRRDRYSRRVALLKLVLPLIGAALLLLVVAWPRLGPLLESVRLALPAIDLREARELKMLNPRYAGTDRFNRPYVVTAAVGHQVPNRNDLMSLDAPRAEMEQRPGAILVLTAATAVYQSQAQLLDLFGDVTLTRQDGTQFVTGQAHGDLASQTAEGDLPVTGQGPWGDIAAQGFRILQRGDTVLFMGQSRLVLASAKPSKTAAAPALLPAEVAKTAAAVEAAAAAAPGSSNPVSAAPTVAAAKPAPAKRAASHHVAKRAHHAPSHHGKQHATATRVGSTVKHADD